MLLWWVIRRSRWVSILAPLDDNPMQVHCGPEGSTMPEDKTDGIVEALLTLGCEGPASSIDVLRAAGLYEQLYPDELAAILRKMTAVMSQRHKERNIING